MVPLRRLSPGELEMRQRTKAWRVKRITVLHFETFCKVISGILICQKSDFIHEVNKTGVNQSFVLPAGLTHLA